MFMSPFQNAMFMATKGLTELSYGRGYESDMPSSPYTVAWQDVMREYNMPTAAIGGLTFTELLREAGFDPNSVMFNPNIISNSSVNAAGLNIHDPNYVRPEDRYFGGIVKAQYGRYLGGFGSSMIPVMAHGGEFMMSAKATRSIGVGALSNMNNFSKLSGPNDAGGGVTNSSSSNVTIHVDTFVGERGWFEKMMSDYNIHIAPSSERARGI